MRHAQEAGALAAIVYDNVYEPLIVMAKPIGHADPAIPAVFVSQKTGVVMQKFLTTGTVIVRIIQVSHILEVIYIISCLLHICSAILQHKGAVCLT